MNGAIELAAGYRKALNSLRGAAALYVVIYHLRYFSTFDWFTEFPVIRYGYLGVDFFFILSGSIISHVYLKQGVVGGKAFWFKFTWYRLARLFPVHFLIMVLMLLAFLFMQELEAKEPWVSQSSALDWLTLTLMIRQWFMPDGYVWNTPAWSISAEFFAYVVIFPIVVRLAKSNITILLGVFLATVGGLMLGYLYATFGTINVVSSSGPLIRVAGGFLIGCGLYCIIDNLKVECNWDFLLIISVAFTTTGLIFSPKLLNEGIKPDILLIISFVVVILSAYKSVGPISKFMSLPILFWFGEISFSLYLCHVPVMGLCRYIAEHLGIERGYFFGCCCVLLSILSAHILYRLVEIPSRQKMRMIYKHLQTRTLPC